jgi:hypothetical protein
MQIDSSFIPKVYDDLSRCTNEQLMQISNTVADYYDTTTLSIVQLTNRFKRDVNIEREAQEFQEIKQAVEENIIFFD